MGARLMSHSSAKRLAVAVALASFALGACTGGETAQDGGDTTTTDGRTTATDVGDTTDSSSDEAWQFRFAIGAAIPNLDPHDTPSVWHKSVIYSVNEALVAFGEGETVELEPILAESWEFPEPGVIRFKLREGVTFTNGEPWNADAAVSNLERITGGEVESAIGYIEDDYQGVEKVDEYTIDVMANSEPNDFLARLNFFPMVPPEYAASDPNALNDMPIGTGPYKFEERTESRVVLVKNEDYWGGPPGGPDRVIVETRTEDAARIAALQAGEVDMINNVPPDLVGEVEHTRLVPPPRKIVIHQNNFNGITGDPTVREGIVAAIDSEGIRQSLIEEHSVPGGCQFATEEVVGYQEDLADPQPYDPDRARQLFEEAGVIGETVTLLTATGYWITLTDAAEIVASQLEAAGLDVDLQIVDLGTWVDTFVNPDRTGVPELIIMPTGLEAKTTTQPWSLYVAAGGSVSSFPHDDAPTVGPGLEKVRTTLDPDARAEAIAEVANAVCEAEGQVFMYATNLIFGVAEDVNVPIWPDERIYWDEVTRTS